MLTGQGNSGSIDGDGAADIIARLRIEHPFQLSSEVFLSQARGYGKSIFTQGEGLLKRRKLPRKG